jgi:predicted dehydrogenase
MGQGDMRSFMGAADVLAVCDVDARRAADAKRIIESHYAKHAPSGRYRGCTAYADFRELLAREDIDAVLICTPDHWHAIPAIAAAKAGKDIFLQKPLTLTHAEGVALRAAVQRYGRILQVGSQQRSDPRFRLACELVRNGRIGELRTVRVGVGKDPFGAVHPVTAPPPDLNYDLWLGPAPWSPYIEACVHPQKDYGRPGWLRTREYCLGMVTGWGSHHMDIAHWGMGMESSGPSEIRATAEFAKEGVWTVHGAFSIDYLYPNGVQVSFTDTGRNHSGVRFEGSEGWVHADRGRIEAEPKGLLTSTIGPNEIRLYQSNDHVRNFLDCIASRAQPVAPVDNGHRSNTACILGEVAMRLARPLRWDPGRECFPQDDEANRLLDRPLRAPWSLA